MPAKALVDIAERRARLGIRHLLAASARAVTPLAVAHDLVALHGTDPASVFLSISARMQHPSIEAIERALYEDRVLVRMLGMRRTMFVVADDLAPVVQSACTRSIASRLKRQYHQILESAGVAADIATWWENVEVATLVALRRRGEATAQELGQDVPELKTQIRLAPGKAYEGMQSVATWMLMTLSAEGKIVRGRPRGSWISSQYRWAPIEAWLPRGMVEPPVHAAQARLVSEWLRNFGPGTLEDLKWWTGLTMGEVKRAVQALDVAEVDLGESVGLVLASEADPPGASEPWVALLPALDPTPMGYAQRDWFLGKHGPRLFDRSGNIGPTVWSDGRIIGGWAQRKNGAVVYELLEDVGREVSHRVDAAAESLAARLGAIRITPRFRTPLERELSA